MVFSHTTSSYLQPSAPARPSSKSAAKMVQELNNKACIHVVMGDFSKANHLLSLALEKHKRVVEDCHDIDELDLHEYDTATYLDESNLSSSALEGYDNEYEDYDMDSSSSSRCDSFDQEQGVIHSIPSTLVIGADTSVSGISKMTRCSHMRNVSYAGQQDYKSHLRVDCLGRPSNNNYHTVYSLPIVVDDKGWEKSSPEDRSFVLVFNSALSNHLWGMELLLYKGLDCYKGLFETAKALYLFALETLCHAGRTCTWGWIRSVDKLCVPAIFNNLSHVSKVLRSCTSQFSSSYDKVLLKSVFWWIDGNSSVYASFSTHASDLRRASDGDAEIVDAFLETVFHLIGAPESTIPAASA